MVVSARGKKTDELVQLAAEMTDQPSAREMDMLLSTGEQESVSLMAMAVHALGGKAVSLTGGQIGIVTDSTFSKARIESISTERIRQHLDAGEIVIACGFQGVDPQRNITTLGRGGSDTTATALAAALQAEECQIYTDVEGVFTTDPRAVSDARKVAQLSYDEMLELASLGAGVMHSRSIEFAKKFRVPLRVRPSFNDGEGTLIAHRGDARVVTGLALARNEARVTLDDLPDQPGVTSRIFECMARRQIPVDMVVQNIAVDGRATVSFTVPEGDLAETLTAANEAIKTLGAGTNTPANHMGPAELEAAARDLACRFSAELLVLRGDELLRANYPAIHAVGRASPREPRLLDLRWGPPDAPRLTLVGKGVCFDTGGLDLKPASAMALMKKDMGGAAVAFGLAAAIMAAELPVRLRVLVPAVENAVSGVAFRPGDVLRTRKGLTVEVGNTDAEGRLVLADALAEASSERPELLIDLATLTGAARVALGPDIPALFSSHDEPARELVALGEELGEPLWRLPLHAPYGRFLESRIADIDNAGRSRHAGAITAALFLRRFVADEVPWLHLDIYAWNEEDRPGRPRGGEASALRPLFAWIERRFGRRPEKGR